MKISVKEEAMTLVLGDVNMSAKAYYKITCHAAKYQQCAVTGILLGQIKNGKEVLVTDAIPLFHHNHYVSPMAEIAMTQIDALSKTEDFEIVGYYAGCENVKDNTYDKCPGQKIAEKIAEFCPAAIFAVINNEKFNPHILSPALNIYKWNDGKWKLKEYEEAKGNKEVMEKMVDLCKDYSAYSKLNDFDNYLDDITKDWRNKELEMDLYVQFANDL